VVIITLRARSYFGSNPTVVKDMGIKSVKRKFEDQLMTLPNVTGVGIGEHSGREIIIVFVSHKVPKEELDPRELIPKSLEGYEVHVDEIGAVTAQ
jgi:hypothetical protein